MIVGKNMFYHADRFVTTIIIVARTICLTQRVLTVYDLVVFLPLIPGLYKESSIP